MQELVEMLFRAQQVVVHVAGAPGVVALTVDQAVEGLSCFQCLHRKPFQLVLHSQVRGFFGLNLVLLLQLFALVGKKPGFRSADQRTMALSCRAVAHQPLSVTLSPLVLLLIGLAAPLVPVHVSILSLTPKLRLSLRRNAVHACEPRISQIPQQGPHAGYWKPACHFICLDTLGLPPIHKAKNAIPPEMLKKVERDGKVVLQEVVCGVIPVYHPLEVRAVV
mmetsp:Transcript_13589/g.26744  ORF Transcript_13589/g.26744 Transcript_13589/m.26744 type:complete len:221 (+) Transcript_13589:928-1590(+)